ncbi:hypothetical protein RhiJN_12176 [Ceratobasidium sp. AG-Ba]|nr:hypothetical protein RhiJN_12176 [Ceratobasidium sp. AG-Ba]
MVDGLATGGDSHQTRPGSITSSVAKRLPYDYNHDAPIIAAKCSSKQTHVKTPNATGSSWSNSKMAKHSTAILSTATLLNITLREVYQTSPEGDHFWKLKECYIRGSMIKYLRVQKRFLIRLKRAIESP